MKRLHAPTNIWLWQIDLDGMADADSIAAGIHLLSADELARASRFRRHRDRVRFIVCRATLRRLLADVSGLDAGQLRFRYGSAGKPYLESSELSFSVSHSENRALIAIGSAFVIGVDVEHRRIVEDRCEVAKLAFSEREQRDFAEAGCTSEAFLYRWTRKEALVKATGEGVQAMTDYEVLTDSLSGWTFYDLSDWDSIGTLAVRPAFRPWSNSDHRSVI